MRDYRRNPIPTPTDLAGKTPRAVFWIRCHGWFSCGGSSPHFLSEEECMEWCATKGWSRVEGEGKEAIDLCPECWVKREARDE